MEYLQFIDRDAFTMDCSLPNDKFAVTFSKDFECAGDKQRIKFDFDSYWKHLRSNNLGRLLIYTDVITSTQEVLSR